MPALGDCHCDCDRDRCVASQIGVIDADRIPGQSVKLALLSLHGFDAETEMLKILEHFQDGGQMIGCPISHDLKVTRMDCRFSFEVETK